MKRKNLLDRQPDVLAEMEFPVLDVAHAKFTHHADRDLELKKLFENEALVRRRYSGVQKIQLFGPVLRRRTLEPREMDLLDRFRFGQKPQLPGKIRWESHPGYRKEAPLNERIQDLP